MQKRSNPLQYFVVFIFLSLLLLLASKVGILKPFETIFQAISSPIESFTYNTFSGLTNFSQSTQTAALKNENIAFSKKLVDEQKLTADNKALRDQFETQNPQSSSLIPANIIGAPGFLPGFSVPEVLVIDKGEKDGVKAGEAVVVKDNLVGKIEKVSKNFSTVILVTNLASSFTVKTMQTQAEGVLKGQGGGRMILDNVLLSDNLQKGDMVLTAGNVNENGAGFLPNLIVGKIQNVSKNASDLFQKAEIQSLLSLTKINMVFVISLQK
jgi:rod shape-determining protein MreC